MKKAVLISIRPEWCKKIITKEKTVEIRKTMPSVISEPFKCYIYCTNGAPLFYWKAANRIRFDLRPHDSLDCKANGMVVGEFTCNGIDFIQRMGIDNNFDYCYLSLNEFGNDDIAVEITDVKKSCIRRADLSKYAGKAPFLYAWHISDLKIYDEPEGYLKGGDGFGWHISDLKIYDRPKSLSGFSRHDFRGMNGTDVCGNESCEHYQPSGSYMLPPTCAINGCCLSKPPQSWCYVAENEENV